MNYEEFKKMAERKIYEYLPSEYQHLEIKVDEAIKVNRIMDGMMLIDRSKKLFASPIIYLNEFYDEYVGGKTFEEVMKHMGAVMTEGIKEAPKSVPLDDRDTNYRIVFQLINTEQNKKLLETIPHREFLDLSLVYRLVTDSSEGCLSSALIKNELAEKLGFCEEELYELAYENTKMFFSPDCKKMEDVMYEIFRQEGYNQKSARAMAMAMAPEDMWIVGNKHGINGAATIVYDDVLQSLAYTMDTDIYIIPSSIHETIAVPVGVGTPEKMAEMVNEVNMSTVKLEERLSNQVYHYDRKTHKLTVASNSPNKRLDGMVAEQPFVYGAGDKSR